MPTGLGFVVQVILVLRDPRVYCFYGTVCPFLFFSNYVEPKPVPTSSYKSVSVYYNPGLTTRLWFVPTTNFSEI